jgi:PAS domain S-box-containing protein
MNLKQLLPSLKNRVLKTSLALLPSRESRSQSKIAMLQPRQIPTQANLHEQFQQALYDAREEVQVMFENIKDYAIFSLDLNGRIVTWNAGAERVFGYSESEAVGRSSAMIFTPEDRASGEPSGEMAEALEKGFAEDERWHMRKDGTRFFASGVMRQLRHENGELRGFIKVARDITERKHLEEAQYQQRLTAEVLRDTAAVLTSTLNLDEVLEHIITTVQRIVPHDEANILLVEQETIARIRVFGYSPEETKRIEGRFAKGQFSIDEFPSFRQIIETRQPVIIADIQQSGGWRNLPLASEAHAYLGVPIIANEAVSGLLNLTSQTPDFFTEAHTTTLQAFASHAAIAIRNAQLHLQAQELAALNERQLIARDLHDAVSQTLFSATIMVESLPQIWQRDPDKALNLTNQLLQMIKSAHAEMRTLFLALRPANIPNTPLSDLLRQLIDGLRGRAPIEFTLTTAGEPSLVDDIHIAIYRIAQEALNNVIKHSQASQAWVDLQASGGEVHLRIKDNGKGFAPKTSSSGFGLEMMRERAEGIGAALEIRSPHDGGTEVTLTYPALAA